MIQLYDANGNELRIPRSKYLEEVLPNAFEKAWGNSDDLEQLQRVEIKQYLEQLRAQVISLPAAIGESEGNF